MTSVAADLDADVDAENRASRYQRVRLWCGIVGIGGVLVSLWVGALMGLPRLLDELLGGLPFEVAGAITALLLGVAASLIQAGPDHVAARLEREYGQKTRSTTADLAKRTLEWLGSLAAAGALLGLCVRLAGGEWWLLAPVVLLSLAFAHVVYPLSPAPKTDPPPSPWWGRVEAELKSMNLPVPPVAWYDHGERSLAGGWNGVGPLRRLFLAKSLADVPPRVAAGLIAREIGHLRLGHRVQTTLATVFWIAAGFVISGLLAPDGWNVPALVFGTCATMSTWCWLGLLGLWPALGRRQVLAADAYARDSGLGRDGAREMLEILADRNLPDPTLPPTVAAVFHPIPPMDARRSALLKDVR